MRTIHSTLWPTHFTLQKVPIILHNQIDPIESLNFRPAAGQPLKRFENEISRTGQFVQVTAVK